MGVSRGTLRSALLVVGAHLSGMPLNGQLTERGARLLEPAMTAPAYRLYALDTDPPKPGLVRGGSASIGGELWAISPAGLGSLLAQLPQPMALGRVTLAAGATISSRFRAELRRPPRADAQSAGGQHLSG